MIDLDEIRELAAPMLQPGETLNISETPQGDIRLRLEWRGVGANWLLSPLAWRFSCVPDAFLHLALQRMRARIMVPACDA